MQVTVQGQHLDVGDALRTHVSEKLEDINSKYFNRAIEGVVKFTKEGSAFIKVHIQIKVGKDILVMADDTESDPYAAFDIAAARIAKQLRRYKRKLRDHHERLENSPKTEALKARDYVLAQQELEEALDGNGKEVSKEEELLENSQEPAIIAEVASEIRTLTVSEAVMRMDLANESALMFRNAKNERLNMVYRRSDGNVGWVDPDLAEEGTASPKLQSAS